MKKLADISQFERLQGQPISGDGLSVFNVDPGILADWESLKKYTIETGLWRDFHIFRDSERYEEAREDLLRFLRDLCAKYPDKTFYDVVTDDEYDFFIRMNYPADYGEAV